MERHLSLEYSSENNTPYTKNGKGGRLEASRSSCFPTSLNSSGLYASSMTAHGSSLQQNCRPGWMHELQYQEKIWAKKTRQARNHGSASVKSQKNFTQKHTKKNPTPEQLLANIASFHETTNLNFSPKPPQITSPLSRSKTSSYTQHTLQHSNSLFVSSTSPFFYQRSETHRSQTLRDNSRNPGEVLICQKTSQSESEAVFDEPPTLDTKYFPNSMTSRISEPVHVSKILDECSPASHSSPNISSSPNLQSANLVTQKVLSIPCTQQNDHVEYLKKLTSKKRQNSPGFILAHLSTAPQSFIIDQKEVSQCEGYTPNTGPPEKDITPAPQSTQHDVLFWERSIMKYQHLITKIRGICKSLEDFIKHQDAERAQDILDLVVQHNMERLERFQRLTSRMSSLSDDTLSCLLSLEEHIKRSLSESIEASLNALQIDTNQLCKTENITSSLQKLRGEILKEVDTMTSKQITGICKAMPAKTSLTSQETVTIKPYLFHERAQQLHSQLKNEVVEFVQKMKKETVSNCVNVKEICDDENASGLEFLERETPLTRSDQSVLQLQTATYEHLSSQSSISYKTRQPSGINLIHSSSSSPSLRSSSSSSLEAQQDYPIEYSLEPAPLSNHDSLNTHSASPLCGSSADKDLIEQPQGIHNLSLQLPNRGTSTYENSVASPSHKEDICSPAELTHPVVTGNILSPEVLEQPERLCENLTEYPPLNSSDDVQEIPSFMTTNSSILNKSAAQLFQDVEDEFDSLFLVH